MKGIIYASALAALIAGLFGLGGPLSRPTIAAATAPSAPDLGIDTDLHGGRPFPANDIWNTDISRAPVDANSDALIKSIGADKPLHGDFGSRSGIPYVVVDRAQKKVGVKFKWSEVSDRGPYPIPDDAPIEKSGPGGDCHVLVLDRDTALLYELYQGQRTGDIWTATCGVIFDLRKSSAQRPLGTTSADAAGLAIFPGLVRYDEVVTLKKVEHAVRFTCKITRKAFVYPARHQAGKSNDPNLPPMGMRVRLKGDFDITGFPEMDQVILTGLKKYGMVLADNGSDWFITGAPDLNWDDMAIAQLHGVTGKNFEVIRMGR